MVSDNVPTSRHHGAPKHGSALIAGLIRCRRCGRKLTLRYSGTKHHIPRYSCSRGWMDNAEPRCIAFGGLRVDDATRKLFCGLSSPVPSRPPPRPKRKLPVAATRFVMLSTVTLKRRVTLPIGHSGNMTWPIPRTGWSRPNWSCDGTGRSLASATSRAGLPRMMPRRRNHHPCRQWTSPRSSPISTLCGRRRRQTQGSRSASCGPSSMRWSPISTMQHPRSCC
ncbi:zinc ribbon domain-containing protein [Mesorhizobium sp. M0598]|uniref:zinc ribbon domain-containing protein n=1 Tax=Mesorhizobium sp. M0598 TaxID=2956968 RepID=UPI003336529E